MLSLHPHLNVHGISYEGHLIPVKTNVELDLVMVVSLVHQTPLWAVSNLQQVDHQTTEHTHRSVATLKPHQQRRRTKVRDNTCAGCCPKNKGLQSTRHEVTLFRLSLLPFDFHFSNNVEALKERHYSSGSETVTLPFRVFLH